MRRRTFLKTVAALPFAAAGAHRAAAQATAWPGEKNIRWLIGLPAGGTTDPLSRAIAGPLSERLGQKIYVENKPGGAQVIAARDIANAPADGYTLLSVGGPQVYLDPAIPMIGRGIDPVIQMVNQPMIIAGTTARDTPDLAAVLKAAREKPQDWSFGHAGYGSSQHVAGELLNAMAGTKIVQVPYRGGGAALQDAVAGQIPLIVIGAGPALPHIEAGRLRCYAVTTSRRLASLPSAPTLQELGFRDFDLAQWHGVGIRSGTPSAITARLNAEMRSILDTPELRKLVAALGAESASGSPAEWGAFYAAEQGKWASLMKRLDIKIDS